jgi:hypothetical protein
MNARTALAVALISLLLAAVSISPGLAAVGAETEISFGTQNCCRTVLHSDGYQQEIAAVGLETPLGTRGANTYLWLDRNHGNAIAANVALSGDGSYAVAGWWLNNQRTSVYQEAGDENPEWVRLMPSAQFNISVDADHTAGKITSTARGESLYVFSSPSALPIHSHWYSELLVGYHCAVSDLGNTYVAAAGNPDGTAGEVRVYDGFGTFGFLRKLPSPPEGVAVSADGSVVASNVRGFVKVWDVATAALRDSIPISGETQTPAVLSGDGTYLVTGGFSKVVRVYQWNGAEYVQLWLYNIPGTTWIVSLAISDDGSTIAAGTWTSPSGGKLLLFDRSSSTPLWVDSSWGDEVCAVALTPDGGVVAAGSWGRYAGTVGNVVAVYVRSSATPTNTISDDGIPGVGSCMDLDLSADGHYLLAGGKAVHAREMGNGGWTMAVELPDPAQVTDQPSLDLPRWSASPNPFRAATRLRLAEVGPATGSQIRIVRPDGRLVRVLRLPAGGSSCTWDGRDEAGLAMPGGVYFASPERAPLIRVVKLR